LAILCIFGQGTHFWGHIYSLKARNQTLSENTTKLMVKGVVPKISNLLISCFFAMKLSSIIEDDLQKKFREFWAVGNHRCYGNGRHLDL